MGACGLCCILVALGAFYRLAIWGFNAIFIYFFLLDQALYLNHFYMIALFGLLLGCTGAHRCWSVDRRLGRVQGTRAVPRWNLLILQFQVEVILVFAGLVKIEVDWLRGEPLRTWMLERTWSPFSDLLELHWVTLAAPVLVILLHVVGTPLLLWSRTRLPVFLAYCAFHIANAHLFNIGVFPWMTIAATTILFSPEWPSVFARRFGAAADAAGPAAARCARVGGPARALHCRTRRGRMAGSHSGRCIRQRSQHSPSTPSCSSGCRSATVSSRAMWAGPRKGRNSPGA